MSAEEEETPAPAGTRPSIMRQSDLGLQGSTTSRGVWLGLSKIWRQVSERACVVSRKSESALFSPARGQPLLLRDVPRALVAALHVLEPRHATRLVNCRGEAMGGESEQVKMKVPSPE